MVIYYITLWRLALSINSRCSSDELLLTIACHPVTCAASTSVTCAASTSVSCAASRPLDWPAFVSLVACQCNGHSQCDASGTCIRCANNTTGQHCQTCAPGYHGNPANGGFCRSKFTAFSLPTVLTLAWLSQARLYQVVSSNRTCHAIQGVYPHYVAFGHFCFVAGYLTVAPVLSFL